MNAAATVRIARSYTRTVPSTYPAHILGDRSGCEHTNAMGVFFGSPRSVTTGSRLARSDVRSDVRSDAFERGDVGDVAGEISADPLGDASFPPPWRRIVANRSSFSPTTAKTHNGSAPGPSGDAQNPIVALAFLRSARRLSFTVGACSLRKRVAPSPIPPPLAASVGSNPSRDHRDPSQKMTTSFGGPSWGGEYAMCEQGFGRRHCLRIAPVMPSRTYARRPTEHAQIARVGCHAVETTPVRSSGVTAAAPSAIFGLCDEVGKSGRRDGSGDAGNYEMTTDASGANATGLGRAGMMGRRRSSSMRWR